MDTLFTLVRSKLLSNMTMHVKGWVGPSRRSRARRTMVTTGSTRRILGKTTRDAVRDKEM